MHLLLAMTRCPARKKNSKQKYFDYILTKYNKYGNGTITIRYFSYTQSCSDSCTSIKMCKLCPKLKKEQAE